MGYGIKSEIFLTGSPTKLKHVLELSSFSSPILSIQQFTLITFCFLIK